MGKLTGKVALIVGAGGGIGRATANLFAAEGAAIVATMRGREAGERVVDDIRRAGGKAQLVVGDAGIKAEAVSMVTGVADSFGKLDILIHNAGLFTPGAVQDLADAELDAAFALNVRACFWLTQAALPLLKKSTAGRIIITTTGARNAATSGICAYITTKMAVNGFVRSAALDLAPFNITVNEVAPGVTLTDMSTKYVPAEMLAKIEKLTPLQRLGQPADIAKGMLYLASDDASWVTGHTLVIDGGGTLPHIMESINWVNPVGT